MPIWHKRWSSDCPPCQVGSAISATLTSRSHDVAVRENCFVVTTACVSSTSKRSNSTQRRERRNNARRAASRDVAIQSRIIGSADRERAATPRHRRGRLRSAVIVAESAVSEAPSARRLINESQPPPPPPPTMLRGKTSTHRSNLP